MLSHHNEYAKTSIKKEREPPL